MEEALRFAFLSDLLFLFLPILLLNRVFTIGNGWRGAIGTEYGRKELLGYLRGLVPTDQAIAVLVKETADLARLFSKPDARAGSRIGLHSNSSETCVYPSYTRQSLEESMKKTVSVSLKMVTTTRMIEGVI